MGTLKAVSRTTLAEQVALQLAEMISDAHWAPGKKLPPESALCETLNVGRSTLREALKSLAFVGMVRMRAGDGTYVAEGSGRILDRVMAKGLLKTRKDLADVCETRVLLETELAALAAKRATASRSQTTTSPWRRTAGKPGRRGKTLFQLDVEFHLAIAEASHNSVLQRLLADIRELLTEWIAKSQEFPGGLDSAQNITPGSSIPFSTAMPRPLAEKCGTTSKHSRKRTNF